MTKLTQQEIEKERSKFEEEVNFYFGRKQDFDRADSRTFSGYYAHDLTIMWHSWLRRSELEKENRHLDFIDKKRKISEITREKFNEIHMCSFDSVDEPAKGGE